MSANAADGDGYEIRVAPVASRLGDDRVRMLAYNGSIPGPTLRVRQGSELTVRVRNDGDTETTIHWHGLRVDNAYDGVPSETQPPIGIGGEHTYRLRFPDPGVYWYHPHVREDYGLDMGLYGNIVVEPADADFWPLVDRDLTVTLDDVLVEHGRLAPFHEAGPTHVAMGRYGNVMLTAGRTNLTLDARPGEVVRIYVTNTANTRLFDLGIAGARLKLVGGDSGRYERETFVDNVLIAPSERAVIDVRFETSGTFPLEHRTPERTYTLGAVRVRGERIESPASQAFETLRTSDELTRWRDLVRQQHSREPDKTLAFTSTMPLLDADQHESATSYVCPMHPDVTATEPGACLRCGMRLVASTVSAPAPSAHHGAAHGHEVHAAETADGLEWEDLMPEMNAASDAHNMIWKLVDTATGKENGQIDWSFRVGDLVKIRLLNDLDQDHPMHHPFHIHGAGRFLVVARDAEVEPNLVWKDTVLVRSGETVDILLEVTNPGLWMAHCHIAEHAQGGMMFSFPVTGN